MAAVGFQFDDETELTAAGEGRWTTQLTSRWNIGENPNGGYLLAPLERAMAEASGQPDPLTVTTHYLRPGSGDAAAEIEVEPVRLGRSVSTMRGRLLQDGRTRLESIAAFTDLGSTAAVAEIETPPVELPPPDSCVSRRELAQGVVLPIMDRLEIRIHPDMAIGEARKSAEIAGWIRFRDHRPVDAHVLTLFADAFPPPLFNLVGRIGWVPTIELTVQVRRRPVEGWIRGYFRTSDATGNRTIEDGWLWDESGALVAMARQVGLVLSAQPDPAKA
jgi:acyl-CoA thioesterase